MRKMKMQVDDLQVESFATAATDSERGTVHARQEETVIGEPVFLPVTDWKTCQGSDCTARTQCHYTCLEPCYGDDAGEVRFGF